jgi:oxygen-independent coproporphyrinogen-3 oxidase
MNRTELADLTRTNEAAPRYTSYPPANFFAPLPSMQEVKEWWLATNQIGAQEVSIYIHIPFCPVRCLFCGCQTEIGVTKDAKAEYFKALTKEIDLFLPLIDPQRPVTQIHFGGGTPNAVPVAWLRELLDKISRHFSSVQNPQPLANAEIAIECDPALFNNKTAEELVAAGFNRVSLGVQDFDPDVLKGVKRRIPLRGVGTVMQELRSAGITSINLDLITGLPGQSAEHWQKDLEQILELRPDRVAAFAYAHVPGFKPHQLELEQLVIPTPAERLQRGLDLYEVLTQAGYVAVGMDHFALPDDELGKAQLENRLSRNFQGYVVRHRAGQVYGFGASSISQWFHAYVQNIKDSQEYTLAILEDRLPWDRGMQLNSQQRWWKALIESVLCRQRVEWQRISEDTGLTAEEVAPWRQEAQNALDLCKDQMWWEPLEEGFELTERGHWMRRVLAARLDPLGRQGAHASKTFSQAL